MYFSSSFLTWLFTAHASTPSVNSSQYLLKIVNIKITHRHSRIIAICRRSRGMSKSFILFIFFFLKRLFPYRWRPLLFARTWNDAGEIPDFSYSVKGFFLVTCAYPLRSAVIKLNALLLQRKKTNMIIIVVRIRGQSLRFIRINFPALRGICASKT